MVEYLVVHLLGTSYQDFVSVHLHTSKLLWHRVLIPKKDVAEWGSACNTCAQSAGE